MSKSKVYSSPIKRSRRLDLRILPKADKYLTRRPYPPGQHGQNRRSKISDYGLQLIEKQKAKFIYGMRERQFNRFFEIAQKSKTSTGEKLIQLLELRLDNVVYRGRMCRTRRQARQMITHGHFVLNNKIINIPSYICQKGDIIHPIKPDNFKLNNNESVTWIKVDEKKNNINIEKIPIRADLPLELNEQLIVEYYSR